MKLRSLIWALMLGLSLALLIGSLLFGYSAWKKSRQIIPPSLKKQISFVIYWPQKSDLATVDKKSIKYDSDNKFLSFVAQTSTGIHLTISEQSTPESFVDIPQAYDKLVESLQQYGALDSINGKVFLTHPKELKGGQSAVMNSKGTLMFVKTDSDLTNDQWQRFFNQLQVLP